MTSITLIHPEHKVTIPIYQAINKCSLFANNHTLTLSPYRVQTRVSLSIFRDFVAAFEEKTVNITPTNLKGLKELCSEFGFTEFSSKLSKFLPPSEDSQRRQFESRLPETRKAFLRELFLFIVNGSEIEREVSESAALFPAVREQLSVDSCARKFFVNDSEIESADIDSLELLLSGENISNIRSQFFLNKVLGKDNLEGLFLNCSKSNIRMNLPETLDNLLLNEFVTAESEDSLLRMILKLGSN
jgi:hypothetical protein